MVGATLPQSALGILSVAIIDTLDIRRWLFGAAIAGFSLAGSLSSPLIGRWADRNPRRVLSALFAFSCVGLVTAAMATNYWTLLFAVVVGGLALGAANPATNKLIGERIPANHRGTIIGLKQAGPPAAVLLAGLLLPFLAAHLGWRAALISLVVLPATGLVGIARFLPEARQAEGMPRSAEVGNAQARFIVFWLTSVGFGVALVNGGLIAFLPLFAQEEFGLSLATAGLIGASLGFTAIIGRVYWGYMSGRMRRPSFGLLITSVVSVLSTSALAASPLLGVKWLWLGAIGSGASVFAWHGVAWFVLLSNATVAVGRASGIMQMGNTLGFALGAPLVGFLVDATGSYGTAWTVMTLTMILVTCATLVFRIRRRDEASLAERTFR